jgi:hypothetical protein
MNRNGPAMGIEDALYDGKTNAHSCFPAGVGASIKEVKNSGKIFLINPNTIVSYLDENP